MGETASFTKEGFPPYRISLSTFWNDYNLNNDVIITEKKATGKFLTPVAFKLTVDLILLLLPDFTNFHY